MELIHALFKWIHIIAGITWIGLLYFFNWINGHVAATLDADSKKKIVPELMPRTLYFFRWGAAWTWITGIVLLYIIFWHGSLSMGESIGTLMFSEGTDVTWTAHVMLLFVFVGVFFYDLLYKSALASNVRVITAVSFVLIGLFVYLLQNVAMFEYRAVNIHLGAMFGTMMAFNVWFRIWPAQQSIITSIKNGEAPNGDLLALAGLRSKHNTYLSVPLIWTMINQHTTYFSGGNLGIPTDYAWLVLLVIVALGWHIVWQLYKKSGQVKGF